MAASVEIVFRKDKIIKRNDTENSDKKEFGPLHVRITFTAKWKGDYKNDYNEIFYTLVHNKLITFFIFSNKPCQN